VSRQQPARPRFPDWPERLAAIVEERRETPFYYGQRDCGAFASDVALALTGEDPAAWLRGRYEDEDTLDAILAERGGFEAAVDQTMADYGSPECPPAFAARGDWALVEVGNVTALGVVLDDRIAVTGLDGLRFIPLRYARRTWAI
tara:strand:- start:26960 stop:27394 length:435 start_codon:yes stop_codon:yes gene_type:complete